MDIRIRPRLVFLALLALVRAASCEETLEYELYPRLPVDSPSGLKGKVNVVSVCIVASEFAGIVPNGGIGTFYSTLAETLANAGHQVTLLFTQGRRSHHAEHGYDYWADYYQRKGIRLVPLSFWRPQSTGYHSGTALMVYDWLRQNRFDVVHFPDWQGHGYYSLLAKHLGLDFPRTTMCCMVHGPLFWARTSNAHTLDTPEDVETDFLERGSIRAAEFLISPSHYLINWIANQTWQIPQREGAIRTQPYILPHEAKRVLDKVNSESGEAVRGAWERIQVAELCFFGRLEVRKGIVLFADVIDALLKLNATEDTLPSALQVTFLGSERNNILGVPSRQYIMQRATSWGSGIQVKVITDKDSAGALTYLKGHGRMAVMPSLVENSPLSILELMGAGIPFVASTAGGIPELIAEEYRSQVLFRPVLESMKGKLLDVIRGGALVPAPFYDMAEVERSWVDFHTAEATKHAAARALEVEAEEDGRELPEHCVLDDETQACRAPVGDPSASVAIAIFARQGGALLQASMSSVLEQEVIFRDWGGPRAVDLIVVSMAGNTEALVDPDLWAKWTAAGGRLLGVEQSANLAGARNAAREAARGDLVLFMDAGCLLETFALKHMLKVYLSTGADAVTSFAKFYVGNIQATATAAQMVSEHWFQVYLGPSASTGLLRNVFGGPVVLFSAEALQDVGGYHDLPVGHDHWEILARMNLAEMRHEVVPQVLAWVPTSSMNGIAVRDYKHNKQWKASVMPYMEAKLSGFAGATYRTRQSVSDALRVVSQYVQVDLTQDEEVRSWMAQLPPESYLEVNH